MKTPTKINLTYLVISIVLALIIISFIGYRHLYLGININSEIAFLYTTITTVLFGFITVLWVVEHLFSSTLFRRKNKIK
jgi:uncharacterized membrane protein